MQKQQKDIRSARKRNRRLLGFVMKYVKTSKDEYRNTGKIYKAIPQTNFRQAIAYNIEQIESFLKTRITRDPNRNIAATIGEGSFGLVFGLENGNVVKITCDQTEAANALFIRGLQRKNKRIRKSTAQVGRVGKIFDKKGNCYNVIEREYIEYRPRLLPEDIEYGTGVFVDNISSACFEDDEEERSTLIDVARYGLLKFKNQYPDLYFTFTYTWDRGLPQMDAAANNIGVRIKKSGKGTRSGNIVIFDFGQGNHMRHCWRILNEDSVGTTIKPKDVLKKFEKRIPIIK